MKNYISLFGMMAILLFSPSMGYSAANDVKDLQYTVQVTKTDNKEITLTSFRRVYVSTAIYSTRYSDVPEVTKTYYTSILLNTGKYSVELPFKIISKIEIMSTVKDYGPRKAIAYLGDGTKVEGSTWGIFIGESSLGDTELRIHTLRSVVFNHSPAPRFSSKANGAKSAIVYFEDGSTMALEGATFLTDKVNKNGCFIEGDYPESFKFNSNDTVYQISWDKIKTIVPHKRNPNSSIVINQTKYTLIMKDGTKHQGYSPYIPNVTQIEGVAKVFGQYRLRVIFSFFGFYSRIELNF